MKKIILALMLFMVANSANAIQVFLVSANETSSGGTLYTMINNGSHISGIAPPTTATWNWDGTTLSSTGTYSAVQSFGSSPYATTLRGETITDLTIDTGAASAGGTSAYTCTEGAFLPTIGVNGCGGYSLGTNAVDESTTVWGPGLAVSQTIGGDDVAFAPFGAAIRTISAYDFGAVSLLSGGSTTSGGAIFTIGNGIAQGTGGAFDMTFQVVPVPAAVWLFGSALGMLGWARRRAV